MHFDWAFIEKWNSGGTLFKCYYVTTNLCTLIRFVWPSQERRPTCLASSRSATGARPTGLAPPMATRSLGAQQSELFSCVTSLLYASMVTTDNQLLLFVIITFADIFQKHTSVSFCPGLTGTEITSWETGATVTLPLVCRGTTTTKTQWQSQWNKNGPDFCLLFANEWQSIKTRTVT